MINTLTKAASIYQEIKKDIIAGELKPGMHLVIKQIATKYGVSDIPVREALKELNAEGLVETIPHVGSRVAEISVKNIADMLALREYLEPFAAELAAEHIEEAALDDIEQCYKAMEAALETKNVDEYSRLNRLFHTKIIHASDNQMLIRVIDELVDSEKRMRMIFQIFPEILTNSRDEHKNMIILLKKHDKQAMKQLMYQHKKRSFDKMRRYFKIIN